MIQLRIDWKKSTKRFVIDYVLLMMICVSDQHLSKSHGPNMNTNEYEFSCDFEKSNMWISTNPFMSILCFNLPPINEMDVRPQLPPRQPCERNSSFHSTYNDMYQRTGVFTAV